MFFIKAVTISLVISILFLTSVFTNSVSAGGGMESSSGNLVVSEEGWGILSDSTAAAEIIDLEEKGSQSKSVTTENPNNKFLIGFFVLAVLIGGGVYLIRSKKFIK